MNYNEIVKKLLELETLNKLKVIAINSNERKVEIEVKEIRRYVIILDTRCVGGIDINSIKIVERGKEYIEDVVVFTIEDLEEFFKNMKIEKEELTYEEKIKQTIKRVLDKYILFGNRIATQIMSNNSIKYTGTINDDVFRIEAVFNDNKTIKIIFTYKDEVEKLHLECETNKKTNSAYIIYDKFVNDISVIRYSIYDNVYDINVLSRCLKLIYAVSNNSNFGNLIYLIGKAIGGENDK